MHCRHAGEHMSTVGDPRTLTCADIPMSTANHASVSHADFSDRQSFHDSTPVSRRTQRPIMAATTLGTPTASLRGGRREEGRAEGGVHPIDMEERGIRQEGMIARIPLTASIACTLPSSTAVTAPSFCSASQ